MGPKRPIGLANRVASGRDDSGLLDLVEEIRFLRDQGLEDEATQALEELKIAFPDRAIDELLAPSGSPNSGPRASRTAPPVENDEPRAELESVKIKATPGPLSVSRTGDTQPQEIHDVPSMSSDGRPKNGLAAATSSAAGPPTATKDTVAAAPPRAKPGSSKLLDGLKDNEIEAALGDFGDLLEGPDDAGAAGTPSYQDAGAGSDDTIALGASGDPFAVDSTEFVADEERESASLKDDFSDVTEGGTVVAKLPGFPLTDIEQPLEPSDRTMITEGLMPPRPFEGEPPSAVSSVAVGVESPLETDEELDVLEVDADLSIDIESSALAELPIDEVSSDGELSIDVEPSVASEFPVDVESGPSPGYSNPIDRLANAASDSTFVVEKPQASPVPSSRQDSSSYREVNLEDVPLLDDALEIDDDERSVEFSPSTSVGAPAGDLGGDFDAVDSTVIAQNPLLPLHVPKPIEPVKLEMIGALGQVVAEFELEPGQVFEIGRGDDVPWSDDEEMLARHAQIIAAPGGGVLLNNYIESGPVYRQIEHREPIRDGDKLRLGMSLIEFSVTEQTTFYGTVQVRMNGDGPIKAYPVTDSGLTIGRDLGDVVLPEDTYVSGDHCRMIVDDSQLYLEDLGSSNGTFILVRPTETVAIGALLLLGQTQFRVARA